LKIEPQTCGRCRHWNLSGSMGQQGYGKCDARREGPLKNAIGTSDQAHCRIGKFQVAPVSVLRERETRGGTLL
jgi:hypothetical protein